MLKTVAGLLVTLVFAVNASAQSERPLGLMIAGPASVGVEWRLNGRVSIRPDVADSWSSLTTTVGLTGLPATGGSPIFAQTTTTTSSDNSLNFGVAVLVTVKTWDHLQAYIAPRAGILRVSSRVQSDADAVTVNFGGTSQVIIPASHSDEHFADVGWSGAMSFGVRHALSDRFSLFGEAGVEYTSGPNPSLAAFTNASLPAPTATQHGVSTRSHVGVVWFF